MRQVVAILVSLVLGAVATAQEPRPPRVDLSVFAGTYDLDEVEYDFDNGPAATEDRTLERDRAGARFAFGPEHVRGFFQFFNEQVDFRLAPGSAFEELDVFGVGGGVRGAPRLNGADAAVACVIPYDVDLAFAFGAEEEQGNDLAVFYLEWNAAVGFGVEWQGIRPSVGLQASALTGGFVLDEDLNGDGDDDDADLSGAQLGAYAELQYKHPRFPMYARLRASAGDYEVAELVLGAAW